MTRFKFTLTKPTVGIVISLIGIAIWWIYLVHIGNIENSHAWACAPGTYYPQAPPQCTGLYNPGIKHDLIFGSNIVLLILLFLSCIAWVAQRRKGHQAIDKSRYKPLWTVFCGVVILFLLVYLIVSFLYLLAT